MEQCFYCLSNCVICILLCTLQVTKRTVVCSQHFLPTCFQRKGFNGRRYLTDTAVPTLFNWTSESKRRVLHRRDFATNSVAANTDMICNGDSTDTASDSDIVDDVAEGSEMVEEYGPRLPTTAEFLTLLATQQAEIRSMQQKVAISRFGLERYSTDNEILNFYTGFQDYKLLTEFYNWLAPAAMEMAYPYSQKLLNVSLGRRRALPLCDELFLTLCRLAAGLLEEDLADRFKISVSTVSRIFIGWINLLYFVLGSINIWPSRGCVDKHMPLKMRNTFPSVRVIIDCTEIFTQKPSSLVGNSQMYSSYKSHATFKCLLGIAPHGPITFVSSLYSGSISDVELTKVCGLLDLLEAGDAVMADKGFTIANLLQDRECSLIIPHFLKARGQFSPDEITDNDDITAFRVHVERAIRRVKENRLFNGVLPLSMLGSVNQIWSVCCLLSNFRKRLF